ncbi:MAG: PD40 domain-containing protein [Acidobacteria bacterium]|nr:PD40 domain-containing protein [Acidobacteriota bacterium]
MQPGTRIGRYEVREKIGAGGLGEVFLAIDSDLGREAAVKILHPSIEGSSQHVRRFVQEAKAASALNHPNLLTVYEIGKIKDSHFIASELIKGETLRDRLRRGPIKVSDTLRIASQMADGVRAAHKAGIIHRDIKPENTMIREDGLVKVLDFGLAKLFDANNGKGLDLEASTQDLISTDPGVVRGTVHYMSPEQARGKSVDARTDVWSLGVVLYEMLAGIRPFEGETASDVLAAILKNEPTELDQSVIGPEVWRIIFKALQKEPDERYQSVDDLALDLKACGREIERSREIRVSGGPTSETGEVRKSNPRFVKLTAIILPVLLLASGAWFFYARQRFVGEPAPAAYKTTEIISWNSLPGEGDSHGSFSPDGKMIAFSTTKSGAENIWVKQTATGEAVQITNDEFNSNFPIWSPNGDEIAFTSERGQKTGVWRMAALGGNATFIGGIPEGSILKRWGKDGTIYFEGYGDLQNLYGLDVAGGTTRRITELGKDVVGYSIDISQDATKVVYETSGNNQWTLWAAPVQGGTPKKVVESPRELKNAVWHPDGRHVFYSSDPDGVYQVFLTDTEKSAPVPITSGDSDALILDITADGTRILYGTSKEESDIWRADTSTGDERPITSDVGSELWPAVSPDGREVVYQSIHNLNQGNEITDGAIQTKSTVTEQPPLRVAPNGMLPRWSPDGSRILYMRFSGFVGSLWVSNSTGGNEKQITAGGIMPPGFTQLPYNREQANYAEWSPDGKNIAYISDRTGEANIWNVSADGSSDLPVADGLEANALLSCPIWSADSKHIAFSLFPKSPRAGEPRYSVWITDLDSKQTRRIGRSDRFIRLLGWAPGGDGLLVASAPDDKLDGLPADVDIKQLSIATGKLEPLSTLKAAYLYNIRLSDDARSVAYAARMDGTDNVLVVSTKGGEAKRVTDNRDPKLYFSNLAWAPDGRSLYYGKQSRRSSLSLITNFKLQ